MVEKQSINGRDVWIRVDAFPVERENPNIIPREYFTATYFFNEPEQGNVEGEQIKDEDGQSKLFESPVAAISFTRKQLETRL